MKRSLRNFVAQISVIYSTFFSTQMQRIIDYFTGYWCARCGELIKAPPCGKRYQTEEPDFTGFGYYHSDCLNKAKKEHSERMNSGAINIIEIPNRL